MRFCLPLLIISLFLLPSCSSDEEEKVNVETLEEFIPRYNTYIETWLKNQEIEFTEKKEKLNVELAGAETEQAKKVIQGSIEENERSLNRIQFRKGLGDYLAYKTPADLPAGLNWENGMENPDIGDSRAKKGGAFRYYISNFPATLRPKGSESNNEFRSNLYVDVEVALVNLHPETLKIIPGVAKEWAVSEDKRTVYFRLDPDAKFNDGTKITTRDFFFSVFFNVSDNLVNPYGKQYYREEIAQFASYDDETLAVTLSDAKPLTPYFASVIPTPSHYYTEYGPDYEERYAWKVPPTSGPYFVRDEDVVKGVSITLTRAKDWWAKDKKFYRNLYNADKMVFSVVRDEAKAFELFKAGEIDYFRRLVSPQYWYEKSETPEFFDGYIEKHEFYHRFPHIPRGLYLNTAKGILKDREVRVGIQHALNFQKVIDVIFRGDYERLDQVVGGMREFTDPSIKARKFSVDEALKWFKKAGFTERGSDGILQKGDGTRLSVGLSYAQAVYYPKVVPILKEEALKAGLEIRLEGVEPTLFYQQAMKKEHEMVFWGWSVTPPFPRLFQLFHSRNAFDAAGNLKTQTNNLNSYANDEMDRLVTGLRQAKTEEEIKDYSWTAQKLAHEEALFAPSWREPFARVGCWRWVRWPDSEETQFAPSLFDRPRESYTWWIDEDMKAETLEAKRAGKTFPESLKVHDRWREKSKGGRNE